MIEIFQSSSLPVLIPFEYIRVKFGLQNNAISRHQFFHKKKYYREATIMFRIIARIFNSKLLRILLKIIGSLASAMIVISGYLAIVDLSSKKKDAEAEIDELDKINQVPDEEELN